MYQLKHSDETVESLRSIAQAWARVATRSIEPRMVRTAAIIHTIGSEVQRPIAVVIVGGTLSACALTLVVLPVMYRAWVRTFEDRIVPRFMPNRPRRPPTSIRHAV